MDAERVRAIVRKLPHVAETVQWGESLVFWVGDKTIGGKMFAVVKTDGSSGPVLSFSAGPERFAELVENEGVIPAPYMARIHWVALEQWDTIEARELGELLADAHALTYAKLPQRVKDVLALPAPQRRALIEERRKVLAEQKTAADAADRSAAKKRAKKAAARTTAKAGAKASREKPRDSVGKASHKAKDARFE